MAPRHIATSDRPRPACDGAARSTGSVTASFMLAAIALGACGSVARADNADGERRQVDGNVQRTAQTPPPARVILPAPWEPAVPLRPAGAPAETADRK
ncbi:hypothetical protein ACFFWD_06355 [Bradyrhizobium erythrophlei]|uniref:hypothetical protein n=1 Tax=Bradyrhizobium erythrophlei TaxID=1437360 RepID=UPI0035EED30C